MRFDNLVPPLLKPHVHAHPTLDTAVWVLQLRWVAVAGQLITMIVVQWWLQIDLPLGGLLALAGITAATNAAYQFWLAHLQRTGLKSGDRLSGYQLIAIFMLTDLAVLTGMLYMSGGLTNPFALFYFVNIAVAGAVLTPLWAWMVWGIAVIGVTILLTWSVPLKELSNGNLQADGDWSIPKFGYLVAFATCGGVITYFITMLTGELKQRELALNEAEEARIRNRQLEGLATLAAGAAHELATPLTTIAVVAKELGRSLEKQQAPESSLQDVKLIRSELDRCRQILDRMTSAAGEAAGERFQTIDVKAFVQETLVGLREPQRIEVSIDPATEIVTNVLPVQATAQAVRSLLQNALDASPDGEAIKLVVSLHEGQWCLRVIDGGCGMTSEVLQRVGEPFFTTKEPGRGMGLGLYLTQNVLRRLGGKLTFKSRLNQGTTAEVLLPTSRN